MYDKLMGEGIRTSPLIRLNSDELEEEGEVRRVGKSLGI